MKYTIDDYVQARYKGSKVWAWITEINFLSPTKLEYTLSFEQSNNRSKLKVLEQDILCKQTSL